MCVAMCFLMQWLSDVKVAHHKLFASIQHAMHKTVGSSREVDTVGLLCAASDVGL